MILEDRPIDYDLLARAANLYAMMGFDQVEVPWIVSSKASMTTAPNIRSVYHCDIVREHFVGSAEQGFIQLLHEKSKKLLPNKYYFSISPCFRRDTPSEIYSRWFMKLELFSLVSDPNADTVGIMLDFMIAAKQVHWTLFEANLDQVYTDSGCDLEYKGLEVGSYGKREFEGNTFIYGTGLALPRAQLIIDRSKN